MITVLSIIAMIVVSVLVVQSIRSVKSTPTPKKEEYLALYPERIIGGRISCGCGSININGRGVPYNFWTVIVLCKSCGTILYTTEDDKKPLEAEVV